MLAALPWTFEHWWTGVAEQAYGSWPFGMERHEIREREPWFAFVETHELHRRWIDLPQWIPATARIHERFPLWILDQLARADIPFEDVDRFLDSERLPFSTPRELQYGLTFADPVRWVETQLKMPTDYKRMVRYWQFQKNWMRLRPDLSPTTDTLKIVQCSGFGIGKTVRLCHRAIYKLHVEQVDCLLGAPEASHVYIMFNIVSRSIKTNPMLHKRTPEILKNEGGFPVIRTQTGQTLYFRWADHDGDSWRGIHILGGMAAVDEAAKLKGNIDVQRENDKNFISRIEAGLSHGRLQGGELHVASVPDGERNLFFERSEGATPLDVWNPNPVYGTWCLWRESKDYQPPPFNTPAKRAGIAADCNGEEHPEFLQQWHGLHGTATEGLFNAEVLTPCLSFIADYHGACLRLEGGKIKVHGYRLNRHYDPVVGLRESGMGRRESAILPTTTLVEKAVPYAPYLPKKHKRHDPEDGDRRSSTWRLLLGELFQKPPGALAIGIDIGESDPTEVLVGRVENGEVVAWVARLQLLNFPHDRQADILYAFADIMRPTWGWSMDATGGPALLEYLYDERFVDGRSTVLGRRGLDTTEVVMSANRELLPELPTEGDRVRVSTKHLAVQLLEMAVKAQSVSIPWDPTVLEEMPGFKRKKKPNGRYEYTSTKDHLVAAALCLHLHVRLIRDAEEPDDDVEPESVPRSDFDERLGTYHQPTGAYEERL